MCVRMRVCVCVCVSGWGCTHIHSRPDSGLPLASSLSIHIDELLSSHIPKLCSSTSSHHYHPSSLPPSLPPSPPLFPEPDVPGIPTEDQLIVQYKQHSGVDFSERELRYAKTVVCLRFISAFQVSWYLWECLIQNACMYTYITHTHTSANLGLLYMRDQCA